MTTLHALVPLFQTVLWVLLVGIAIVLLRPELRLLRHAVQKRLEAEASIEIGPLKLGALRSEIRSVREDVAELALRVSQLFLTTMAPPMYLNLRKLVSGEFGLSSSSSG